MKEIRRVLVPTDFSSCSDRAVQHGARLAEQASAAFHLVHVTPPARLLHESASAHEEKLRSAQQRLSGLVSPRLQLRLSIEKQTLEGLPAEKIVDYAQQNDIDMIVMGTHGRAGLAHVTLGSVAEKVLRSSPCPVLVVRATGKKEQLPLKQAAFALRDHFGDKLAGDRAQTRARMKGRVAMELQVSEVRAVDLVEKLESVKVLTWDDSDVSSEPCWRIEPDRLQHDEPAGDELSTTKFVEEPSAALDLVHRALLLRATDVHLDPTTDGNYSVRLRIDGRLQPYCEFDAKIAVHMTHQLRMLSGLEMVDHFRPQEGRLRLPPSMSSDLEVRITTAPVAGGDATALRLFSRGKVFLPLSELGFDADALTALKAMLQRGEGLVLVTGPTGSGKTTTVYSMLEYLGSEHRNVVSIEDPVEFFTPFVRQMSVDESHGVSVASGLRTMLRMDPDIVFVGEIRDTDAAEIAMRAAASGRHVFSTLHTRDVAATVTALRDLNVDQRSIAANLRGIVNQRLLRCLCPNCCQAKPITDQQRGVFVANEVEPPAKLVHPIGCDDCRGTGYHGRTGVFEAAISFEEFGSAIVDDAPEDELRQLLRSRGTLSLTAHSLKKASAGITSLSEAIEVHWI